MNIFWIILSGVVGFLVGRMSIKNQTVKSLKILAEMRSESKEALEERTESRKEEILEMMSDFEVQEKIVEKCDIKNAKKGIEREDIEKRLGVSDNTALKYLNELEKEGKIEQKGKGLGTYYSLKK
jgi:predicted HTH transcriptional regulator